MHKQPTLGCAHVLFSTLPLGSRGFRREAHVKPIMALLKTGAHVARLARLISCHRGQSHLGYNRSHVVSLANLNRDA